MHRHNDTRAAPPAAVTVSPHKPPSGWQRAVTYLRGRFTGGLLLIAPFVITYLIFKWLYDTGSGVFDPVVEAIFGRPIPGISVAALLLLTFLIGIIAIHFLGQRLLYGLESLVIRVPIIGPTFSVLKQLISTFGPETGAGFSRVVEIEYPRKGMWAIGFLTAITEHGDGKKMAVVYVPTAPTPNTGWLALVPLEDVFDLDMTAGQALSMTISAGIASPAKLRRDNAHSAAHSPDRDPGAPPGKLPNA